MLIRDVTLRDGLQILPTTLTTARKVALYEQLCASGLTAFQVTSFVSPRRVPQLADAEALWSALAGKPGQRDALVANLMGYQRARAVGADRLELVLALSPTYHRENSGRSQEETMADYARVIASAKEARVHLGIGLANAWHCTFEGATPPDRVLAWGDRFYALGVRDIGLADTTGAAHPGEIAALVRRAREAWPDALLRVHLHEGGRGVVNARAARDAGADGLDVALHGIGGSPFAGEVGGNLDALALAEAGLAELDAGALARAWDALSGWLAADGSSAA